jgi:predicted RNase H-like HicB family nuclease
MRYVALIDGRKGAYGVAFPDLPGCVAMGRSVDEAIAHAADALRDWVETTAEAGEKIPSPRTIESLRKDAEVAAALAEGAAIASVALVRHTGRPARANMSLDSGVLAAIDDEARRRKITRSGLVELLAREALPKLA